MRGYSFSRGWMGQSIVYEFYRVRVTHKALLGPAELRAVNGEFRLN
jgi:uncharacterized protein Usg